MRGPRWTEILAALSALALAATAQAAPAPAGHERTLHHLIEDAAHGRIDYAAMTPELAGAIRAQAGIAQSDFAALGELKTVTFERVDGSGSEFYRTEFERGALEWAFSVNAQGLIANAKYRKPAAVAP